LVGEVWLDGFGCRDSPADGAEPWGQEREEPTR